MSLGTMRQLSHLTPYCQISFSTALTKTSTTYREKKGRCHSTSQCGRETQWKMMLRFQVNHPQFGYLLGKCRTLMMEKSAGKQRSLKSRAQSCTEIIYQIAGILWLKRNLSSNSLASHLLTRSDYCSSTFLYMVEYEKKSSLSC